MVKLNPKIKIAGIELNTAMKNFTDSRFSYKDEHRKKGVVDADEAISFLLSK